MHRILATLAFALLAACATNGPAGSDDPVALRKIGVERASQQRFQEAETLLRRAAEAGYFTAQLELAYLLESSPAPVQKPMEAYAWYTLVLHRGAKGNDKGFAEDGRARVRRSLDASSLEEADRQAEALIARLGTKHYP